ncbi:metal-dependent transcriptional regulator [Nesterenkonia cremea]|nr:metal-dependent transcriptional regulator [Nesterenkonia cremea]
MTDLIDTTEMYLRTILDLEEEGIVPLRARIAERLEHSGPTVSQTVARMERDGLLNLTEERRLELTEDGRDLAVQVMRKHRLAERLLSDVIGLDWPYIHEEACRWEHVMSERVERRLVEILDSPVESPYGNPIPGLEKLGLPRSADAAALALTTLRQAAEDSGHGSGRRLWVVQRLAESIQVEPEVLEQLLDAGLRPGAQVELGELSEAYVTLVVTPAENGEEAGALEVELPLEVAQHIFVAEQA